jgi:hypothetical protein
MAGLPGAEGFCFRPTVGNLVAPCREGPEVPGGGVFGKALKLPWVLHLVG